MRFSLITLFERDDADAAEGRGNVVSFELFGGVVGGWAPCSSESGWDDNPRLAPDSASAVATTQARTATLWALRALSQPLPSGVW